jgi:hypothetical protein
MVVGTTIVLILASEATLSVLQTVVGACGRTRRVIEKFSPSSRRPVVWADSLRSSRFVGITMCRFVAPCSEVARRNCGRKITSGTSFGLEVWRVSRKTRDNENEVHFRWGSKYLKGDKGET